MGKIKYELQNIFEDANRSFLSKNKMLFKGLLYKFSKLYNCNNKGKEKR